MDSVASRGGVRRGMFHRLYPDRQAVVISFLICSTSLQTNEGELCFVMFCFGARGSSWCALCQPMWSELPASGQAVGVSSPVNGNVLHRCSASAGLVRVSSVAAERLKDGTDLVQHPDADSLCSFKRMFETQLFTSCFVSMTDNPFLARDSIVYMLSAQYAIARPSVRSSVTRAHQSTRKLCYSKDDRAMRAI